MNDAAARHQRWKDREARNRSTPPPSPSSDDLRGLREQLDYSQSQAAALIYVTLRRWQMWEQDVNPMHPALWELFTQKARAILAHRAKGPPGA